MSPFQNPLNLIRHPEQVFLFTSLDDDPSQEGEDHLQVGSV